MRTKDFFPSIARCLLAASVLSSLVSVSPQAGWAQGNKKQIVCTLPTLSDIARRIAGDQFDYVTLAPPTRDPHTVEARPSLMRQVSEADLFLKIGMQLERWADQVTNGSGNPKIFPGAERHVTLSGPIPKLEVPDVASRSVGHIHPQGNPHFWLDPVRTKILADEMAKAMKQVASAEGETMIDEGLETFRGKINQQLYGEKLVNLVGENRLDRLSLDGKLWAFLIENEFDGERLIDMAGPWLQKARPLHEQDVIEYHQEWIYFLRTFGMNKVGTIEEKPGIPPGPRHLRETKALIQNKNVNLILVDNFYDPSSSRAVAKGTGAQIVVIPSQVGGAEGAEGYFQFMDYLLTQLVDGLQKTGE